MAWSLGNIKWTIPFMSLNGTSCRINIYERGYTGSTVTELSTANANAPGVGGVNPFFYEEDDDDDLLSVIRYKTGYINLVEKVYGGLEELFPINNTDLYVEFYQGSSLNFIGFIQAQNFENPWKSAPREISLPVISPLGLLDSITMPTYNPPQALSLAACLDDVLNQLTTLGVQFYGVTWPQLSTGLDATISSLVTSPFNSDITPGNWGENCELFSPVSARTFVEGLCNCFGWMVHEAATQLVFTKFDHTGNYNYVLASNLRTLTNIQTVPYSGSSIVPLTYYVTPADPDGKESGVMPVEKVRMNYDGEYIKSCKYNFDHMIYNGTTVDGNQAAAWLTRPSSGVNRTPEISDGDIAGFVLSSNSFYQGKLVAEGVNPCSCGTIADQTECLLLNLPQQGVTRGWLFTLKFYDRPTGDQLVIKWKSRWGDTLLTLTDDDTVLHKEVAIKVIVGNLWYAGNGVWQSSQPSTPLPFNYGSGEYEWQLLNVPAGMPIEIRFYEQSQQAVSHRAQTLTIEDLTIEELPSLFSDYRFTKAETDIIKNGNGDGEGETSVSMLFSPYRVNSNMVGSTLLTTKFTDYQYMLKSKVRNQIRFKKRTSLQTMMYFVYMSFMSQNWRVISMSEYPWDDEVVITMQRVIN